MDRGPAQAELAAELAPELELEALALMRAVVRGQTFEGVPDTLRPVVEIAERVRQGRYVAVVYDAEPGRNPHDDQRADSLM